MFSFKHQHGSKWLLWLLALALLCWLALMFPELRERLRETPREPEAGEPG